VLSERGSVQFAPQLANAVVAAGGAQPGGSSARYTKARAAAPSRVNEATTGQLTDLKLARV
jgi:hypothetical protein